MRSWLGVVVCASAALAGCSSLTGGGFQARGGASRVSDPAPDGPDGTGAAIGMRFVALTHVDERLSIGGHALLGIQVADAKGDDNTTSYLYFDPGLHARLDLGRFALHGWLAYALGVRSVDDGGTFDKSQLAFHGPTLGAAVLVRLVLPGKPTETIRSIELGPYIDFGRFAIAEESDETDFVEDGMRASALTFGVMMQFWGGGSAL